MVLVNETGRFCCALGIDEVIGFVRWMFGCHGSSFPFFLFREGIASGTIIQGGWFYCNGVVLVEMDWSLEYKGGIELLASFCHSEQRLLDGLFVLLWISRRRWGKALAVEVTARA